MAFRCSPRPTFGLPLWLTVFPAILLVVAIALLQNHMVFAPLKNSQPITPCLSRQSGCHFLLRSGLQLYFGSELHCYQTAFYESIELGGIYGTSTSKVSIFVWTTSAVFADLPNFAKGDVTMMVETPRGRQQARDAYFNS